MLISVSEGSPSHGKCGKLRIFNKVTKLREGPLICSISEIFEHDHKFVAYSKLIKYLELCKTENMLFPGSNNYFSLIQFLTNCPHSFSDFQRRSPLSKNSTNWANRYLKIRKL